MRNFLRHLNTNVSDAERGASFLAGAYFLYDALGKEKKSGIEAVIAGYLLYRGISGNCFLYNAIGKTKPDNRSRNVNIQLSLVVDKPREEVYNFWRNLENLPLFMEHLESVESLNDSISVWEAHLPGHVGTLRWKSEIVKERPFELLGWQSLPGSSIENAGKVEFRDAGEGTELHIVISYHAPGGIPGESAARLLNPVFEDMVEEDVRHFKWFIERDYNF
ncbi:SRPBCC family protein [Salinimicrobium sp. 3283s]|uniref:SRPBCC family protein n=1 Tax=Salinimicrobium sp. 3283s TaxID=3114359 RepID=UPI0031F03D3B